MSTNPEAEMRAFFDKVIAKVVFRNNKPGNSPTPWKEFGTSHLRMRLGQEIAEWQDTCSYNDVHEQGELIDIAAMAMFVSLSIDNDRIHEDRRGGDQL